MSTQQKSQNENITDFLKDVSDTQKYILEEIETLRYGDPEEESIGDKAADYLVDRLGSWGFVIGQSVLFGIWILLNVTSVFPHFDPPPFVGFNLFLSAQAAYATAFILIAQKRMSIREQRRAVDAYRAILNIEKKMEEFHKKIKDIKNNGKCETKEN